MGTSGPDDPGQQEFRDKLADLQKAFRAKLPGRAAELEAAVTRALDGDGEAGRQVAALVHKLSGSAGSFGALELSDAATAVDLQLRAGTAPTDLIAELRALIAAMRAHAEQAK